jgi:hypothetical protein
MGRPEALALLKRCLLEAPSTRAIEAVPPIADADCVVLLGRIARAQSEFADAALHALEAIPHPLAARISERLGQE